jgi:ADP-ribosylglycohydrolase
MEASVDDSQAHGIIKVPLLVARYAGSPLLLPKVKEAVEVHQKSPLSLECSLSLAKILERVVLKGESVREAVTWAETESTSGLSDDQRSLLREARTTTYPQTEIIKTFGMSCALPGALKGALYVAVHAPSFAEGIRFSTMAGGDNCSRNIVIGALLAAANAGAGPDGEVIPAEWKAKSKVWEEVHSLSEKVVEKLET